MLHPSNGADLTRILVRFPVGRGTTALGMKRKLSRYPTDGGGVNRLPSTQLALLLHNGQFRKVGNLNRLGTKVLTIIHSICFAPLR